MKSRFQRWLLCPCPQFAGDHQDPIQLIALPAGHSHNLHACSFGYRAPPAPPDGLKTCASQPHSPHTAAPIWPLLPPAHRCHCQDPPGIGLIRGIQGPWKYDPPCLQGLLCFSLLPDKPQVWWTSQLLRKRGMAQLHTCQYGMLSCRAGSSKANLLKKGTAKANKAHSTAPSAPRRANWV